MVSIFIVDDDIFLHKVLERILSIGGHTVTSHAYDGAEAVAIFKKLEQKPDIILMDHRMPVMNGVSSTKEILHIDPDVRILFISADETVRTEALECGAIDFLTKPIRSVQLFAAIDKHLGI